MMHKAWHSIGEVPYCFSRFMLFRVHNSFIFIYYTFEMVFMHVLKWYSCMRPFSVFSTWFLRIVWLLFQKGDNYGAIASESVILGMSVLGVISLICSAKVASYVCHPRNVKVWWWRHVRDTHSTLLPIWEGIRRGIQRPPIDYPPLVKTNNRELCFSLVLT